MVEGYFIIIIIIIFNQAGLKKSHIYLGLNFQSPSRNVRHLMKISKNRGPRLHELLLYSV